MTKSILLLALCCASVLFAQEPQITIVSGAGSNATFNAIVNPVSPDALGADATLAGAYTFDFTVTTGSDILLFDAEIVSAAGGNNGENVAGGWYNNAAGTDANAPNPLIAAALPALLADTFVTTPNATSGFAGDNLLNGAGPDGETLITVSDSTLAGVQGHGAQTDFTFGRITLLPDADGMASLTFRGELQTAADDSPIKDQFEYMISIAPAMNVEPDPVTFSSLLGGGPDTAGTMISESVMDFAGAFTGLAGGTAFDSGEFTVFAPIDAATNGVALDIEALTVPGSRSADDLQALIDNGTMSLTALSGDEYSLEEGSILFGDCTILNSYQVDNGWVHIVECVPEATMSMGGGDPPVVPEPGSLSLVLTAMIGCLGLRRRK